MALTVRTAGESHGPAVLAIVEGLPAGLAVERARIDAELARRQKGYGRGGRMQIEDDRVDFLSGVRHGRTIGSPVTLVVRNRDHENWKDVMSPDPVGSDAADRRARTAPRPGHADLAGALKYRTTDLRDVIERSSARDTAARTAAGLLCQSLLDVAGIGVRSHVVSIEGARLDRAVSFDEIEPAHLSDTGCVDADVSASMRAAIDAAKRDGDTLGGELEIVARGVVPGLGTYAQWTERLDGRLAQALMSIPSCKAVAVGAGLDAGRRRGSAFHDPIGRDAASGAFTRASNHAGGIEGGVSNGEEIRATIVVKPIPTLLNRLPSVDLKTGAPAPASIERSDVCVVPAAAVVAEAMTRIVLASALLETIGGDSRAAFEANLAAHRRALAELVPR